MGGAIPREHNIGMTGPGIIGRDDAGAGPSSRLSAAEVRAYAVVYSTDQIDSIAAGKAAVSHTHVQADVTGLEAALAAKIGGSVGANDNRLVRSDGVGGLTVQTTGITVDDGNNVSGVGTLGCGVITSTGATFNGYVGIGVAPTAYVHIEGNQTVARVLKIKGTVDSTSPTVEVLSHTNAPIFTLTQHPSTAASGILSNVSQINGLDTIALNSGGTGSASAISINSSNARLGYDNSGSKAFFHSVGSTSLVLGTNSTDRLTIGSTGNITTTGCISTAFGNNGVIGGGLSCAWVSHATSYIAGGQIQVYESGNPKIALIDTIGIRLADGLSIAFSSTASVNGAKTGGIERTSTGARITNGTAATNGTLDCAAIASSGTITGTAVSVGTSGTFYVGAAGYLRLADYVDIRSGGTWGIVDVSPMTGGVNGMIRISNGLWHATNYERLEIGQQTAGDALIRTAAGGTGTRRNLTIDAPVTAFSGLVSAGTYTAGTLPSAASNAYKFATVSDSSVTTFGTAVAGGGSSKVMVFSNGSNWTVCAA